MLRQKTVIKKSCIIISLLIISSVLGLKFVGHKVLKKGDSKQEYGVFFSLDSSDMQKIAEYQTVVIDAQFFSEKDITYLKAQGCTVYSYLNIGSIENFREYYDRYSKLALGNYENWEEEQWVDVSSRVWQEFLVTLEEELLERKIDGFFVDNCDVYYEYSTDAIFEGLTTILEHLMEYGKPVIINGGDTYVRRFQNDGGSLLHIMTGVNQETVWSRIDFDTGKFSEQSKKEQEYFKDYIETCSSNGLDVYLLEYTSDDAVKQKIKTYCTKHQFHYYISDSIELD